MIQCIQRLQNFGIFRDFTGNTASGVPAFKKRNLIYGWNYSGKTTISRLFQALQFPDSELPYSDCCFNVKFEDGTEVTNNNRATPLQVRVFNRDYINTNFEQEHTAPAVFIVGERNLELRARLEAIREAQTRLSEREVARQIQISQIQNRQDSAGTERARSVANTLGVRNFQRPSLFRLMGRIRSNPSEHQLANEQLQANIDTYRLGDQFSSITPLPLSSLHNLIVEIESVKSILLRTASFDAIEGLRENRQLEDWFRNGLSLHESPGTCKFCKGTLTEERLNMLQSHFSTASQALLAVVNQKINQLKALRFEPPRLQEMQFLQELRTNVRTELERLSAWLQFASSIRDDLVVFLEEKRTNLEVEMKWDGSADRLTEGIQLLETLNQCIHEHNEKTQNIDTVKRHAREAIELHNAATFFVEQNVLANETEIGVLRRRNRYTVKASERLDNIAEQITQQIDRAGKGAERFMELVTFLLQGSDIQVESRGEIEFQLMRGTTPADKLSDGEKTAIAFAYFITSFEGEDEDISNTIVYIDDPISSLDSNHVYAVYALICEKLQRALQLFISTHNSEFFSLLKGLWLGRRPLQAASEAFYVRRTKNETGAYSVIESLPRLLRKYKSEYEFIFAQLHSFASDGSPSEHEAYTAPNLLRRFLEAYLGFRKPCTAAWHAKLDILMDSPEACREIHKLLDDGSHLQRPGRALEYPSFVASAQSCTQNVIDGLRVNDPMHYDSLIEVINQ